MPNRREVVQGLFASATAPLVASKMPGVVVPVIKVTTWGYSTIYAPVNFTGFIPALETTMTDPAILAILARE